MTPIRNPIRAPVRLLTDVIRVDTRALAVFRIGFALIILLDLAGRAWNVSAFLTDSGILSRMTRLEMVVHNDPEGWDHQWSLHLLSGEAWAQLVMIAVASLFAIWLLVGYRTRVAAVISWVLLVSIQNRNPLVHDAGDSVLRTMLFWSLFVPLGASFSIDKLQRSNAKSDGGSDTTEQETSSNCSSATTLATFGSAALLLQLMAIYFSASMYKLNAAWLTDFSAVYYAMNIDPFVTPLGLVVREYPTVMKVLTASTVALEFGGILLLLVPWGSRWIRLVVAVAFMLFHLGLAATMTLGLFPWICIAAWMLFIPSFAWDRLESSWKKYFQGRVALAEWAKSKLRWLERDRDSALRTVHLPGTRPNRMVEGLVALLFIYAVAWNVRDAFDEETAKRLMPDRLNGLARVLGLEKGWSMFAPVPRPEDGWPIFQGTLRDGTTVNLWQPAEPLPWKKPPLVSAMYVNQRWRRYLENLTMDGYVWYRPYFCDWLQERWNREYSMGEQEREVAKVEILRQLETTPPPGQPFPEPETITLWSKEYGDTVEVQVGVE